MLTLFVPDIPEFTPLISEAGKAPGARVFPMRKRYTRIEVDGDLILNRKSMGLKPAIWYALFVGGIDAEIVSYDRDEIRLIGSNRPR